MKLILCEYVNIYVDKVENFYGCLSLHNNIFCRYFPSNFFIMSGPCSTKISVLCALASVKLETPPFATLLS